MVFNNVLELNGRKERNIQVLLRNWLLLPSFSCSHPTAIQSCYKLSLLAGELQGVNQSWFTKYFCQAFSHPSSLPPQPTPFVNVNHFLMSLVVVNFTPSFSLWRTLGVNGRGLGTIVVCGCLLVQLRHACGKKVGEGGEMWAMRLGNRFKLVSFFNENLCFISTC